MIQFVCLMYHNVVRPEADGQLPSALIDLSPSIRSYFVTANRFRQHLNLFGKDRWLDPAELLASDQSVPCPDSQKPPGILLTFDDGWTGSFEETAPLLEEANARAIVFVTTGLLGHPLFISPERLKDVPANRFEIGAHTVTHPFLAECQRDVIREELVDSKKRLEDLLERPVETLSVPNGSIDRRVREEALNAGYKLIFTSETRINHRPLQDCEVGRLAIRTDTSDDTLLAWGSGRLGSAGWKRTALQASKKILGPQRYRRMRSWAIGQKEGEDEMQDLLHHSGTIQNGISAS